MPVVSSRIHDFADSMAILKAYMPAREYAALRVTTAPDSFIQAVSTSPKEEF